MMKTITKLAATAGVMALLVGCSGQSAKDASKGATKKAVEVTKGALTGLDEGFEEGRKAAESTDGARIVSTHAELQAALTLEVLAVKPGPQDGTVEVTIGLVNAGDTPVRLTSLDTKGHVIALDKDGYVCNLIQVPHEVTVPAAAKLKLVAIFSGTPETIGEVRVMSEPATVPPGVVQLAPPATATETAGDGAQP
jgi:hypothetical protein